MSKVSVIIPAYNSEKYIKRCIASLQRQVHRNIEIIIFDDHSIDGTRLLLDKATTNDSRITVIRSKENLGPMYGRMECLVKASGKYTIFVDSDDTLPHSAIAALTAAIERTHSDIVTASYNILEPKGKSRTKTQKLPTVLHSTPREVFTSLCKGEVSHSLWAKIYRTSLLKSHKYTTLKNFTNGEDAILFYEILCNATRITSIEDVVYNYHITPQSSSNRIMSLRVAQNIIYSRALCTKILESYDIERSLRTQRLVPMLTEIRKRGIPRKELYSLLKQYNLDSYISFRNLRTSSSLIQAVKNTIILRSDFITKLYRLF
ncbi:MAG: glycosyltransferase family 2 protein [Rikenellaceae bacterium]